MAHVGDAKWGLIHKVQSVSSCMSTARQEWTRLGQEWTSLTRIQPKMIGMYRPTLWVRNGLLSPLFSPLPYSPSALERL